jgi:hypothetical protein
MRLVPETPMDIRKVVSVRAFVWIDQREWKGVGGELRMQKRLGENDRNGEKLTGDAQAI